MPVRGRDKGIKDVGMWFVDAVLRDRTSERSKDWTEGEKEAILDAVDAAGYYPKELRSTGTLNPSASAFYVVGQDGEVDEQATGWLYVMYLRVSRGLKRKDGSGQFSRAELFEQVSLDILDTATRSLTIQT